MLLLEGIVIVFFGLGLISQGTEPGASILIIIALPVLLFGIVLTIVGIARALKETRPDDTGLDPVRLSEERSPIEDALAIANSIEQDKLSGMDGEFAIPEQQDRERQSHRIACPGCGAKYGFFERLTQPTMCSACWKTS